MNFNQFVVRNTVRNKHLYLAYFLSTLFAVMVFFTFSVFAFHPSLTTGLNSNVQLGMLAAAIIIYGFSFFFVLYSMDVFLQSRKKEFGLLMIQGMSPRQLRKMVFIENLVIGFFATLSGSVLGIVFSQLILWLSDKLMHVVLGFYFPTMAFGLTFVAFLILFFAISFFIQFRLPKLTLQELLKSGDLGKGEIKSSAIKGILAVILIIAGYAVAVLVPGLMVPVVMIPVIVIVVIGTRFLFNQLSIILIQRLQKNQKLFWKKTNMVVFSDLAFRMKDNARSFFLVSIISTVAFAAIGTLYGFQHLIVGAIDETPYEFQVVAEPAAADQFAANFDQILADQKIDGRSESLSIYQNADNTQLIAVSDYNRLAKSVNLPEIKVDDTAVQLTPRQAVGYHPETVTAVTLPNGSKLSVKGQQETNVVAAFGTTLVVPDSVNLADLPQEKQIIWNPQHVSYQTLLALGKTQDSYEFSAKTYTKQMIIDGYAPILFVGIFIGIVFFVSAGSFLYFRLYSDMDTDVEKFKMIYKLGLTKKELRKMLYQQVGILFFTPIIVSVIHGAVALTAMYHIFGLGLQSAGLIVLGVFILIQILYYLIARTFYFRKVYRLVQM